MECIHNKKEKSKHTIFQRIVLIVFFCLMKNISLKASPFASILSVKRNKPQRHSVTLTFCITFFLLFIFSSSSVLCLVIKFRFLKPFLFDINISHHCLLFCLLYASFNKGGIFKQVHKVLCVCVCVYSVLNSVLIKCESKLK